MNEKVFASKDHDLKFLKKRFQRLNYTVAIMCAIGLALCAYALRVELMKEKDHSYKAFCDIDSYISCTKVFFSKYGRGFGLLPEDSILNQPNTIYGILFFLIQLILLCFGRTKLKFVLSVLANLGNVYLAYILYFVLKDFCIVCVGFYVINGILLVVNYKHLNCGHKIDNFISKKSNKKLK